MRRHNTPSPSARSNGKTNSAVLLLLAIPLFVGNQACAGCHADIAKAYGMTPMAMSSGPVKTVNPGSFRHTPSGVQYDIDATGLVQFSRGSAKGEERLKYFIGSAAAGRSFLVLRDGFLFEAPVTWYSRKNTWDASPGYEQDRASKWDRAVEPSCLFCHASQTQWRPAPRTAIAIHPSNRAAFPASGVTAPVRSTSRAKAQW